MAPEAATHALGLLALRYAPAPMPWTDANADQQVRVATMAAWVDTMAQYPEVAVLAALERVCTEQPQWAPNLNQLTQAIQAEARRLMAQQAAQRQLEGRVRCNGSSWVERSNGLEPCPACNPLARELWAEGQLHLTGDALKKRTQAWLDEHGAMPPRCTPPLDDGRPVDFPEGRRLAAAAYRAECEANGRTPKRGALDRWLEA